MFRYDAPYQLTEATGRADNALTRADFRGDVPTSGSFRGTRRLGLNDGGAVARYRRTYAYGIAMSDPQSKFDARGQITSLPNVQAMQWSPRDQRRRVVLIERTGDPAPAPVYLGECELKRITQGSTLVLERWSSHVEDGDARLATLYRWSSDPFARETDDTSVVRTHYHLGTHLGSVALELGAAGEVLAYEEYFPYGGTAFLAGDAVIDIAFRTRRFVGKDQDDATGFCVFQFRYYAPFLGSWVSPDPASEVDGPNRYWYARNNPTTVIDPLGLAGELMTGPMFTDEAAALRYYNRTYARFQMRVITDLSPYYQEDGTNVPGRWVIASERPMTEEEWQATLQDWRPPDQDLVLGPRGVGPTAPPSVGESEEPAGAGDTGGELPDGPVAPHVERALDELGDELGQMEGSDDPLAGLPGIPVTSGADSGDSTGREAPSSDGGTPAPAGIPAPGSAEPGSGEVGTGTGTSGVGTGAGGEGTGTGAGGASAGRSSTSGSAGGSGGTGRGRGAGTGHDRRRARSTPEARAGRRSRARAGGPEGTTRRDRPRGTAPSANGNATVPGGTAPTGSGLPSGVVGGVAATPSPTPDASTGNQPGAGPNTPGGSSPMSGIAGSDVGSATGLNPNAGVEGGSTGALEGGSPTGSQFGTRSGQDDGSVLSGAETGEGAATTTDRVIAAAGILAGNTVGYNPNDPAATEDGAGGVFGWIDLGPLNAPLWLISAIGLAIIGVNRGFRQAAELAGEVTRRGAGLLNRLVSWVGGRLRRLGDDIGDIARRLENVASRGEPRAFGNGVRDLRASRAADEAAQALGHNNAAALVDQMLYDPHAASPYFWVDPSTGIRQIVIDTGTFGKTRAGQLVVAAHELVHAEQWAAHLGQHGGSLTAAHSSFFVNASSLGYATREFLTERRALQSIIAYAPGGLTPQQVGHSTRYLTYWAKRIQALGGVVPP